MNDDVAAAKRVLRGEMRQRMARLSAGERLADSAAIRTRLESLPEWREARAVLAFAPLPSEPDILPGFHEALRRGQEIFLPRWNRAFQGYEPALFRADAALVDGPFGVPEPGPCQPSVSFERLDLILVPGLAFDWRGHRLGRGRGFYDRILAGAGGVPRWGVAFDRQIVAEVPCEPHDVMVELLVTPSRCMDVDPA